MECNWYTRLIKIFFVYLEKRIETDKNLQQSYSLEKNEIKLELRIYIYIYMTSEKSETSLLNNYRGNKVKIILLFSMKQQ